MINGKSDTEREGKPEKTQPLIDAIGERHKRYTKAMLSGKVCLEEYKNTKDTRYLEQAIDFYGLLVEEKGLLENLLNCLEREVGRETPQPSEVKT